MLSIIQARVSRGDLCHLFGVASSRIDNWIAEGLSCGPDGKISLLQAIQWRQNCYREAEKRKPVLAKLTQKQLIALTGRSRMTIFKWHKAGLPRNKDGSYNLADILQWLPSFYDDIYRRKHQRLARKMSEVIKDYQKRKLDSDIEVSHNALPKRSFLSIAERGSSPLS